MTSCRKIGEMNNNINNQPLYSMGVYMCLELPGQQNIPAPAPTLLDYNTHQIQENIQNLSNSSILNSQNITKLLNPIHNASNITTNLNISNSSSIIYTSVPATTLSPTTTPSATTPSPTTTTPSPTTVKPTTLSPSTDIPFKAFNKPFAPEVLSSPL